MITHTIYTIVNTTDIMCVDECLAMAPFATRKLATANGMRYCARRAHSKFQQRDQEANENIAKEDSIRCKGKRTARVEPQHKQNHDLGVGHKDLE